MQPALPFDAEPEDDTTGFVEDDGVKDAPIPPGDGRQVAYRGEEEFEVWVRKWRAERERTTQDGEVTHGARADS